MKKKWVKPDVKPLKTSQIPSAMLAGQFEELKKLYDLKAQGTINQDEFEAKKKQLLKSKPGTATH